MEQLKQLVEQGLDNIEIGKLLNINRITVARRMKRYNIIRIKQNNVCLICDKITSSRRKRCDGCNTKIRRYRAKKTAVEYLGGECNRCGWSGNLSVFDFHHKNPKLKDFGPSSDELANKSWSLVKKELDKCELLCANCHRLEHNDYHNEKFLKIANEISEDLIFKNGT
jgi:hypothetical protein